MSKTQEEQTFEGKKNAKVKRKMDMQFSEFVRSCLEKQPPQCFQMKPCTSKAAAAETSRMIEDVCSLVSVQMEEDGKWMEDSEGGSCRAIPARDRPTSAANRVQTSSSPKTPDILHGLQKNAQDGEEVQRQGQLHQTAHANRAGWTNEFLKTEDKGNEFRRHQPRKQSTRWQKKWSVSSLLLSSTSSISSRPFDPTACRPLHRLSDRFKWLIGWVTVQLMQSRGGAQGLDLKFFEVEIAKNKPLKPKFVHPDAQSRITICRRNCRSCWWLPVQRWMMLSGQKWNDWNKSMWKSVNTSIGLIRGRKRWIWTKDQLKFERFPNELNELAVARRMTIRPKRKQQHKQQNRVQEILQMTDE